MEIQGTDGSKTQLNPNSTSIFGRNNLINPKNLSISRNHISIDPIQPPNSPPRVSIQVIGKNPVWIYSKIDSKGKKVKTLKRFEKGELGFSDLFCVSGKNPIWFSLNEVKNDGLGKISDELNESLEGNFDSDFGLNFVDVSDIDPVQEFGFLVIGHEFDQYPKKMIREIKNWDWFLDDPVRGSDDDDDDDAKGKTRGKRKRKKTRGDDDVNEEWTAESEGEEELTKKATMVSRPKYQTRSKDPGMSHNPRTNKGTSSKSTSKKEEEENDDDDEEDEEDQTLGGFIVDDEIVEEEDDEDEGNEMDDDDEEEFVEDEEDELEE